MAASKKQVNQAKKMADQGKSAGQIARATGVSGNRAGNLASSRGPMPSSGSQYTDGVTYQLNDQGTAPVSSTQGGGGGGMQSAAPSPYQDGVTYQLNDAGTAPVGFYQGGNLMPMGGGGAAASSRRSLSDAKGLGEALRIAGGRNANISKKELQQISEQTGKSADRVVRKLDVVNEKRATRRKAPIGLGSGAFNSLLGMPTSRTIFGKTMSELGLGDKYSNFGTGPIGRAVMQGKGSSDYYGNATPGTGKIPKGRQVIGSYNNAPETRVKPSWDMNAGIATKSSLTPTQADITTDTTTDSTTETTPTDGETPMTPDQMAAQEPATEFGNWNSADIMSRATGFRTKKGSRARAGSAAQGLASQRVSPFSKWQYNIG